VRARARGSPYRRFQSSAVYRSRKKFGKLNKEMVHKFQNARQARTGRNIEIQQHKRALDSSSFVLVPTLPRKLATILLLAFSLFELVAALSQDLCSGSNKQNREVGEYPQ